MAFRTIALTLLSLTMLVATGCGPVADQPEDSPSTSPTPLAGRFSPVSHPTASCACNGDIIPLGGDGRIDSADTTQLDLCVLVGGGLSACDVNCDGEFGLADHEVIMCISRQRGQNCCAPLGACVQPDGTCADDKVLTCRGCNTKDICAVRTGATYYGGQRCADISQRAPQNDRCENALPLTMGTRQIDTRGSFAFAAESHCDAAPVFHDVWFSYQSRTTGRVTIETCGSDIASNVVISVYDSAPKFDGKYFCPSFDQTPVACSAPGCGSSESGATVKFPTLAGRDYILQIATKLPESQGILQLSVSEEPSLFCGDGVLQNPEQCDDGNKNSGDGCDSFCVAESAGGSSCTVHVDCISAPENNACNHATCVAGICTYSCRRFGDTVGGGCLDDILCTLAGFGNAASCPNGDIHPCETDGDIDIDDILSVLLAFSGGNPCGCTENSAPGTGVPPECGVP